MATQKTTAQKTAEKAMWMRNSDAFQGDAEVQALCETMLAKYAPTEAETFAYDLLDRFTQLEGRAVYHTSKEWSELVGSDQPRKVVAAITRLVKDGKMAKCSPEGSKVGMYCVA